MFTTQYTTQTGKTVAGPDVASRLDAFQWIESVLRHPQGLATETQTIVFEVLDKDGNVVMSNTTVNVLR